MANFMCLTRLKDAQIAGKILFWSGSVRMFYWRWSSPMCVGITRPTKGCTEPEGGGRRGTPSLCMTWAVHLLPLDIQTLVRGLLDLGHDLHCWPLIVRPLNLDWMAPLAFLTPACRWQILGLCGLHTMKMAYRKSATDSLANGVQCWA